MFLIRTHSTYLMDGEAMLENSQKFKERLFSKQAIIIMFLFIAFFLYALFLLQDLSFYMYGFDDFQLIYDVLSLSSVKVIQSIFLDPLQLYQGFLGLGVYQRSVHGLFLKISYILSNMDPSWYHTVRAIFFTLSGVLVYIFTKKIVSNTAISISAGFLYMSLPVIYDSVRHIGAAEPFSQFFMVVAVYFFARHYDDPQSYKGKQKYLYPLILFMVGVFAIKARETEIVLVFVLGSFLLLKYKNMKRDKGWWLVVVLLSLYVLPALFNQLSGANTQGHDSIKITSEKVIANINHLLFYNPVTRTGNGEQTLVLFSLPQYVSETPGSLLGSIGFFLGWYLIAMICVYGYSRLQRRPKEEIRTQKVPPLPSSNYITLALLWFIGATVLMMLYVNPSDHSDIRYIGVIMTPCVLLVIPFCYFMTRYIQMRGMKYVSKYIFIIFMISLLLSVIINASITGIYRRGGIGSRHLGMAESTRTIFEDLYNQSFDNAYFFAITEISGEGKYIPCVFSTNISLADVTVTNDPFLSMTRLIENKTINYSLSKYGYVYLVSYAQPLAVDGYPDMQLVKEISTCNDEQSYYCRLKNLLKKQSIFSNIFRNQLSREPRYFVYKIVRTNPSYEKPVKMLCAGKEGLPKNSI